MRRLLLCAGKIHGGQIQNITGLIDTGIHNPQQARLRAGLLQPFGEQEGTDREHHAVQQLHASAGIKRKGQHDHAQREAEPDRPLQQRPGRDHEPGQQGHHERLFRTSESARYPRSIPRSTYCMIPPLR